MGKLLTILGVTDQSNLTEEIITAENLIIGMQYIYENSPENEQKESLAKAIAETIRLTLQQIKGLPLTPPQAPELPQITDLEKGKWYIGVCYSDDGHRYDILLRFDKLQKHNDYNQIYSDILFFGDNMYEGGLRDNGQGNATMSNSEAEKSLKKASIKEVSDYIENWAIGKYDYHITRAYKVMTFGESPTFYVGNDIVFQDYKWDLTIYHNKKNAQKGISPKPTTPRLTIVQVGDIFKHATETKEPPYNIIKVENGKVTVEWTKNSTTRDVEYDLREVIDYINNGNWIRVNNQQNTPAEKTPYKVGDYFLVDAWDKNDVGIITSITDEKVNFDFSEDKGLNWESGNDWRKVGFENWIKKGEVTFIPKSTPKPTAKKGTRQSPKTSANDVKEGTKKKGIDGNMWVSRKTSVGYNQWKKIK